LDSNRAPAGGQPAPALQVYAPATTGTPGKDDRASVETLARIIHGHRVTPRSLAALPPDLLQVADYLIASEGLTSPEARTKAASKYIDGLKKRRPAEVIQSLTSTVKRAAAADPGDEPEETPAGPPPFTVGFIDSATFFGQEYRVDYLIDDLTAKDQPSTLGGPSKTLKTSLLVAKVVSLATGTPYLGRFNVPRPVRCGIISGESGKAVIQSTARHVCTAQGVTTADLGRVLWSFSLPTLTDRDHLRVLQKEITDNGLEYVAIDPFYLSIVAGRTGVDMKDMFQVGPILADVAAACLDVGCTPEIAHHFVKNRENTFAAPELNDLAFAGFNQFVAQWMLVAPRERYDAEVGLFKLTLSYGGRAGHSGELAVDIEVGKREAGVDRRCWKVTVATPSEVRDAKKEEADQKRKDRELQKAVEKNSEELRQLERATAAFRKHGGMTQRGLKAALGVGYDTAGRLLFLLTDNGTIEPGDVVVATGTGNRTVPGYVLKTGEDRP
jgi:hypothetical protein